MNREDVIDFEKCQAQLKSLYDEIGLLSKKSTNDPLNNFKVNLINTVVRKANYLLGKSYKPFDDFTEFDSDTLPTNSDVVMILAQYLESMEILRSDNIEYDTYSWYWKVDGEISEIKTHAPAKSRLR